MEAIHRRNRAFAEGLFYQEAVRWTFLLRLWENCASRVSGKSTCEERYE
jgi:hypothetical protein